MSGLVAFLAVGLSGCSVININGSLRTDNNEICVIDPDDPHPEIKRLLRKFLQKKNFVVRKLPHGTPPGACYQTIVYEWAREQYYLPVPLKQFAINIDVYVDAEKYANASFDPMRNVVSAHVKFVRFSRYLARLLDRLFPGRPLIGK